jgi:hypothetical protein
LDDSLGLLTGSNFPDGYDYCYDPDYALAGVSYDVSLALDARTVDRLLYSTDTALASKCSVSDTTALGNEWTADFSLGYYQVEYVEIIGRNRGNGLEE